MQVGLFLQEVRRWERGNLCHGSPGPCRGCWRQSSGDHERFYQRGIPCRRPNSLRWTCSGWPWTAQIWRICGRKKAHL